MKRRLRSDFKLWESLSTPAALAIKAGSRLRMEIRKLLFTFMICVVRSALRLIGQHMLILVRYERGILRYIHTAA